jgi:putative ABC transport system permease protein
MIDDARFAFRQLRKNPGFAAIAVTTLGLGIGAASAMFGLIQGVLLSPPPYTDPGRVVLVSPSRLDGQPYRRGATIGQWLAWRQARSIEPPAMYRWTFNFLVLPDGSESLGGMVITPNYFRVLGLRPVLGREFTDAEVSRPNVPPTAIILGYDLWQRKFNGDPNIIGKTVRISRQPAPLPVVGVMPQGIRFLPDPGAASEPNYDVNARVDFWVGVAPDESRLTSTAGYPVTRLSPGATVAQAQADVAGIAATVARTDPALEGISATVSQVQDVLNRDGRRLLMPLFGSVALVFFIACANVAGLLLTRGLQRHSEYAMRSALGAGRWRLVRQGLTESVVLSLVGAALGAGIAAGIVTLLKSIGGQAVPRSDAVSVGWPVFAFGLFAAVVAAAVAGLLPAARASLPDRFQSLKGSRSSASRGERRLLGAVATLQIVMTVALLAGAALLVRTARNLDRVQPGYDTERILAMTVTTMEREKSNEFHRLSLERVSAIPGVTRVAFAWGVPLTGNKWSADVQFPGQSSSARVADRINLPLRSVTPGYFDVMGMTLAEGRSFRDSDNATAPRVAIVNAALAKRYFADRNPVGQHMHFAGSADKPLEIVGMVADTRTEALSEPAEPEIYLPFWQSGAFSKHLVVRAAGDPLALAAVVRREIRSVDPTSAVERMTTMAEIRRESVASRTFAMRLLTGFAVAATLLALVGLYGVLSLSVSARTKEIAVRKAIGAQPRQIAQLVVGEGWRMIAIGLVLGTITALLLGRLLGALLFNVKPADPVALLAAAAMFGSVALGACLLPAYRATRVDLMESLRQE